MLVEVIANSFNEEGGGLLEIISANFLDTASVNSFKRLEVALEFIHILVSIIFKFTDLEVHDRDAFLDESFKVSKRPIAQGRIGLHQKVKVVCLEEVAETSEEEKLGNNNRRLAWR